MPRYVLDENIVADERRKLEAAGLSLQQIGIEIPEVRSDAEVIRYLHRENRMTFITRNVADFYRRRYCHARYCLLCLDVSVYEIAQVTLQLLRHLQLNTMAKRMGKVVRATKKHIWFWALHTEKQQRMALVLPIRKRKRRRY